MADFEKRVRSVLSEFGCTFSRHGKGDHHIWKKSILQRFITVDGKIKSRHTANAIMKQAGIDRHF